MSQLSNNNFLFTLLLFRHKISVIVVEEVGAKVGFNYVSGDVAVPINVISADFLGGVQSHVFASWVNAAAWTHFFALFGI